MIEIIIIWRLAVRIGQDAAQKGLRKPGYQIMAVLLWLCGEIVGGLLGSVIFGDESSFWARYLLALLGAFAGAAIAFVVMRFVPNQESLSSQREVAIEEEASPLKKFGRSGWLPTLVIFLAFACLCSSFGVAFLTQMRSMMQQIRATNPVIGVELNNDGQISKPMTEMPASTEIIYLSFFFDLPVDQPTAVDIDWSMNGQLIHSFSESFSKGQAVTKLDRTQLGLAEFPKGIYEVSVRIGSYYLASTSFVVK